jgi:CheY-like chemotaxis protein
MPLNGIFLSTCCRGILQPPALPVSHRVEKCLRLGLAIRKLGHTLQPSAFALLLLALSPMRENRARRSIAVTMKDTHFKILLVDDQQLACKSTATLLEMSGHKVRTAFDGRSAIRIAEEFSPDIVILDIGLPDISGYELLSHLKQFKNLETAIFIALTGFEEETARSSDTGVNFHHFLRKPVDTSELKALLQNS